MRALIDDLGTRVELADPPTRIVSLVPSLTEAIAASALETPLNFAASLFNDSVQKMAFYFAEHLPEAVYLPISQPPKISA